MLQVVRMALGLGVAILAAIGVGAAMGLPLVPRPEVFEPPIITIAKAALPYLPFLAALGLCAIAVAEPNRFRQLLYWLLAGCIIAMVSFHALQSSGLAPEGMFAAKAPLKFVVMGALGGIVYWLIAGRSAGTLAAQLDGNSQPGTTSAQHEQRRCAVCTMLWLLLGLVPLGLLGWQFIHNAAPPLVGRIIAKAEADGTKLLKDAGVTDLAFKIDGHTGHITGSAPDAAAKAENFAKASEALKPLVGQPGVIAILQNDIVARQDTDPAVAAENARIKAAAEEEARQKAEADRLAAEAAAKRKAEEEAREKAEAERVARAKAEAARLTAEIEAKRKAEEEAKRKAEEEARAKAEADRIAAEIEAKRKAAEDQARQKAEAEKLAAEIEAKRKAAEEAQIKAETDRNAQIEAERKAREAEAQAKAAAESLAAEAAAKRAEDEQRARGNAEVDRVAAVAQSVQPRLDDAIASAASADAKPSAAELDAFQSCAAELEALTKRRKIFFKSSSSELRKIHAKILDAVAALSKRCTVMTIVVSGHTDYQGREDANQLLSEERAEAVRAALVERGVDSKQLEVRAYAWRQPADGVVRRAARAADRRAEFAAAVRAPSSTASP